MKNFNPIDHFILRYGSSCVRDPVNGALKVARDAPSYFTPYSFKGHFYGRETLPKLEFPIFDLIVLRETTP